MVNKVFGKFIEKVSLFNLAHSMKDIDNLPPLKYPGQVGDQYLSRDMLEKFYEPWIKLAQSGTGVHCGECGCWEAPEVKHRGVLFQDFSANMKYIRNGFRILKKIYRDIDLAHSNTYIPVLLGGIAKKLFRVKHVVTIHDVGLVMGVRFLYRWFREGGSNAFASYVKALIGAIFENNIVNTVPNG